MSEASDKTIADREYLAEAHAQGGFATLKAFLALSGPGWLQSAITLGGGSLASSLYLGVLAGYSLLWAQPLAMILGIIMLSAIGYVTMSTGERPFKAINEHVNPVLGWGWALACGAANIVWCLPQYSLAFAVLSQNLMPGALGGEGSVNASFEDPWLAANGAKLVVSLTILVITVLITWSYDSGGWGLKLYETVLKLVVGLIVLCFVGVVVRMSTSEDGLPWGEILAGFIPDFRQFFQPAATFQPLLDKIGPTGDVLRDYWQTVIVSQQRDVMISAAATAVGINMTFLFPYSILRKGWDKTFRGLAIFDLATGMLIPYLLATSCVVIAAASQFHTQIPEGFVEEAGDVSPGEKAPATQIKGFNGLLTSREQAINDKIADGEAPQELAEVRPVERHLAAVLVKRDAVDLSGSLAPLTGSRVADIIFGIGVLAMALSTISILMLISGFVFCEILALPPGGWPHRIGTLLACLGALGPFVWSDAAFYLAVPTSVFGFVLLPMAYLTFLFLMNQKSLLGEDRPTGGKRLVWNLLMLISASVATYGSVYMVWVKGGLYGIAAVAGFTILAILVGINRAMDRRNSESEEVA